MNFNTYMPEYNWVKPIIDWESIVTEEMILDDIFKQDIDVLCISTYEWNTNLCHEIAKQVKQRNPSIVVVKGGPQQGHNEKFFDTHPYIDYLCHATGHGELFLKEFLKQYAEHGKVVSPEKVTYLISRDYVGPELKIKYSYPEESSIEKNMTYLIEVGMACASSNGQTTMLYETTRGCPYSCVYCEWGGGTGSKVSAKSVTQIKKELEIISLLRFESLEILDANFGILKRDVEVAEYIVELSKKFGYPKEVMLYGLAKTTSEKKEKILDIFHEAGLMQSYFIATQTLDPNVMDIIQRTDVSVDEHMRLAKKYNDKYNSAASLEFILGLPGFTIEEFYQQMNYFQELNSVQGWRKMRNILTMLPNTPLADPEYIKKHSIKVSFAGSMENEENDTISISNSIINKHKGRMSFVTETFSFSSEEWKEMFILNRLQREIGPRIKNSIKADKLFKYVYEQFEKDERGVFNKVKQHLDDLVDNKLIDKDALMIDNRLIETVIYEDFIMPNKELFADIDFDYELIPDGNTLLHLRSKNDI
jgi:radical SAM superfamily enzyme YgiQ (UPF0313 family)